MKIADRNRKIFLRLRRGYSHEEVAGRFAVSVDTVKRVEKKMLSTRSKPMERRSMLEKMELMDRYHSLLLTSPKLTVLQASVELEVEYRDLQYLVSTLYRSLYKK